VLGAFKGSKGSKRLTDAAADFIAHHQRQESEQLKSMSTLLRIRSLGVDDPEIDILLASATGVNELAKSALARGANVNVTLPTVLAKHRQVLLDAG
jgi:hypothetical protein